MTGPNDILESSEDRYGSRSTVVTSQLTVGQWHASGGGCDTGSERRTMASPLRRTPRRWIPLTMLVERT
ncbi:hypothetical protein [Afipia birgiae]|uniref:hypothetical protein n=1 Tax=Afipia birgiae TaxID=151414 RepID=UPI00036D5F0A|nr:hypothetical protein [Afipia birgiae]